MLFVPFKADLSLYRVPAVTILICSICLTVYYGQVQNEAAVIEAGTAFCEQKGSNLWRMVLKRIAGETGPAVCAEMMLKIHLSNFPHLVVDELASKGKPMAGLDKEADKEFKREIIQQRYTAFERQVPKYDTQQLWYQPDSWDIKDMITATFAHSSWSHVVGNLFFFFAFAAAVELILGSLLFGVVVLMLALGTNVFYSLAVLGMSDALPTVGLSGVVMGIMGLFVFFVPSERIKCFFWFLIIIRIYSIPAWLLVTWYVGWDIYDLFVLSEECSEINLVAHVSGAALGYLSGVIFFRNRRLEALSMLYDA